MAQSSAVTTRLTEIGDSRINHEAYASGVSWPAIIAGAFVTAALWLILLALGAGIGLSAVSPWARADASAATLGMLGIFWLIIVQIMASAMGGYLAGGCAPSGPRSIRMKYPFAIPPTVCWPGQSALSLLAHF